MAGRIHAIQLRMRRFQRLQFPHQPVVLGIGNDLLIELVIGARGVGQLYPERGDALGGLGIGIHAAILTACVCVRRVIALDFGSRARGLPLPGPPLGFAKGRGKCMPSISLPRSAFTPSLWRSQGEGWEG
ncbi:hypothetical protein D3C81_1852610 [compost metagenome]